MFNKIILVIDNTFIWLMFKKYIIVVLMVSEVTETGEIVPAKVMSAHVEVMTLYNKRHFLLYYYRMRDWHCYRFGHWYCHGFRHVHRYRVRHRNLDWNLYRHRYVFLHRIRYRLIHRYWIRLRHVYGVWSVHRDGHWDLHRVRDMLLHSNRVRLRYWHFDFLGDGDGLHFAMADTESRL